MNELGEVSIKTIEAAIESLKKSYKKVQPDGNPDEIKVGFEYIIGSFFPNILDNIKDSMKYQHTLGYSEGYSDGLKAKDHNEI